MAEHDRFRRLWIKTREMEPVDASLPDERWHEYEQLCQRIDVKSLALSGKRLEIVSSGAGESFGHGFVKGYIHSQNTPGVTLQSLDHGLPPELLKSSKMTGYIPLQSSWYIFLRQD